MKEREGRKMVMCRAVLSLLLCVASAMTAAATATEVPLLAYEGNMEGTLSARVLYTLGFDVHGVFGDWVLCARRAVLNADEKEVLRALDAEYALSKVLDWKPSDNLVVLENFDSETMGVQTNWVKKVVGQIDGLRLGEVLKVDGDRDRLLLLLKKPLATVDWAMFPHGTQRILVSAKPYDAKVFEGEEGRLRRLRETLAYRDDIDDLISRINESEIRYFAEYLSGEHASSSQHTRLSPSDDAVVACEWAMGQYSNYGFNSSLDTFRPDYCPNIIAEIKGTVYPDSVVIIGAHIDDRAANINDETARAPGANDDGSGSSAMLEIARVISESGARFRYTVRIGSWCGEEQGLIGSRAYAGELNEAHEDVIAMIQADMIGWRDPDMEPGVAFVTRYTDNELTSLVREVATMYVPEIPQHETTACCSDHQSFYEVGYASAGLVEPGGYSIDPEYHQTGDVVNRSGYNIGQIAAAARVILASTAVIAEME